MTKSEQLKKKINSLPPHIVSELESYIDFLLERNNPSKSRKVRQTWAGGLKNLRKKYTSLELQKKASEWRR